VQVQSGASVNRRDKDQLSLLNTAILRLPLIYKFFLAERDLNMVGIYKFTNKITGESYIGQSVNIHKRYIAHKNSCDPSKKNYEDSAFHRNVAKYGFDNFEFSVLEECEKDKLNEREIYYIEMYGTLAPGGYNVEAGGMRSTRSGKLTLDEVYVIQQDLKDGILTLVEIGQKHGISYSEIYLINNGKHWRSEYETYPLRKLQLGSARKNPREVCSKCGKPITEYCGCKLCRACFYEQQHKFTPSKDELANMLSQYRPTELAKMLSVCRNTILNWRNRYGLDSHGNDIAQS